MSRGTVDASIHRTATWTKRKEVTLNEAESLP